MANLRVVNRQIAVWYILYLVEVLPFSTNFKQMFSVNKKIARFWITHLMTLRQLITEESLAKSTRINFWGESKHHSGIVDIYLVWARQIIWAFRIVTQQQEQPSTLKRIKHFQSLIAISFQFLIEFIHLW